MLCKLRYFLAIAAIMIFVGACHAKELLAEDELRFNGFIGQGIVASSANRFYGSSENGRPEMTETGINASWQAWPHTRLAGQLIFRNAGEMDAGEHINLDYLLLDYKLSTSRLFQSGLRLGRYKNPLGFYNATRDIPMTRPSIFLPQSIYFDRVRNAQLSTDGIEYYYNHFLDDGDIQFEAGLGSSKYIIDEAVKNSFLGGTFLGELEPDGPHFIGRILYEHQAGKIRAGLSAFAGELEYQPADINTDPLSDGGVELGMYVASLQYNSENWNLTGEMLFMDSNYYGLYVIYPQEKLESFGWYLQGEYHLHYNVSVLLRYDVIHDDKTDKKGEASSRLTGIPAHTYYAKDWTAGLSWYINEAFMFRTEYHYIEGTTWLSGIENENVFAMDKYWDLFAVYLSYRF